MEEGLVVVRDLLEFLFGPLRNRLYDVFFRRQDEQRRITCAALERIRKERPNCQHIVAGGMYKSAAHEKAVTQTSFKLLAESMVELQNIKKFSKSATALLKYACEEDAAAILTVAKKLEPRLEKYCGTYRWPSSGR